MRYPTRATRANLIAKAASYARCDRLNKFYATIEGKKSISTRKLGKMLDNLQEDFKLDAIFMKNIADKLPKD